MRNYSIVPLESTHIRADFQCGNIILDDYIKKRASQDIKRKLSVCYVLIDVDQIVAGYYTLSNSGIARSVLPEPISKKLPGAYATLPITLLGRLAVDQSTKGKGYGKILLAHALKKSLEVSKEIGSMAVIVDPIDLQAVKFYTKFDFRLLQDSGKMFLPMKTISGIFD